MITLLVDSELHTLIAKVDRLGLGLPLVEGRLALGEVGLVGRGIQAFVVGASLYIAVSGVQPDDRNERGKAAWEILGVGKLTLQRIAFRKGLR